MPASPPARDRARDPWFDNVKMTLVTLAVVGHAWSFWLPRTETNVWFYDFLYVWHMPAFVLVSGYFSRSFDWSSHRLRALVATLVVPFVLYQAALVWFQVQIGWGSPEHPFLEPLWPLWYLVALVLWRLAAPVFTGVPAGVAVAGAVAISLWSGTLDATWFSLSKVLGMLPFFVVGLVATPERVAWVRSPRVQLAGVACLLATLLLVRHVEDWTVSYWLYYRPYALFWVGDTEGMVTRAVVLGLGLVCAVAALSLVPGRRGWFTGMGAATLTVLLGHAFVVRGVEAAGLLDWTAQHEVLGRLVVPALAVGLSLLLASPPVVRALAPLVDPVTSWRRRAGKPGGDVRSAPVRAPRPTSVHPASVDVDSRLR